MSCGSLQNKDVTVYSALSSLGRRPNRLQLDPTDWRGHKAVNLKENNMAKQINTSDLVKAFTDAMTHEGVEAMMSLWAPGGEWVIMATGETFKGPDKIRELATRSIAARTHGSGEALLPFNVFSNAAGTKLIWEYVHKGVVTDQWPSTSAHDEYDNG